MNKLPLFALLLIVSTIMWSCKNDEPKKVDSSPESFDSIKVSTDTQEIEEMPPAAVDSVFNDFVEAFVNNKSFQLSRVQFPLPHIIDSKESKISKEQWEYDPIHKNEDIFTMTFDRIGTRENDKDSIPTKFLVEKINLDKGRIKQYQFIKNKGAWRLVGINEHDIKANTDGEFYTFYQKFVSDENFQQARIMDPFTYKTFNEDSEYIEGTMGVEQWEGERPELPSKEFTNFICGDINPKSKSRTFVICSPTAENVTIEFRYWGSKWKLTSLEK